MNEEFRSTAFRTIHHPRVSTPDCGLSTLDSRLPTPGSRLSPPCRRGVSVLEVMIALTVMCIFIAMSAPSFSRGMEHSRADLAGANLRAIWTAQRLYWLEYETYASDLAALEAIGLVDPTLDAATEPYTYQIVSADATTFTAKATRSGSAKWSGNFQIDESGDVWGKVTATGEPNITPGFL
jgi:Tfp pilus assembly protein PilE